MTPSGRTFLPHGRRLLRDAEDLEMVAQTLQESLSGTLPVGCFDAMSLAVLPPLVVELGAAHPGVRLDIRLDSQDALVGSFLGGEIELALVCAFEPPPELAVGIVAESVVHALLPAHHPRASQRQISVSELKATPP
jgi:DNA-binding transcriptional LysR family regulator